MILTNGATASMAPVRLASAVAADALTNPQRTVAIWATTGLEGVARAYDEVAAIVARMDAQDVSLADADGAFMAYTAVYPEDLFYANLLVAMTPTAAWDLFVQAFRSTAQEVVALIRGTSGATELIFAVQTANTLLTVESGVNRTTTSVRVGVQLGLAAAAEQWRNAQYSWIARVAEGARACQ